MAFCQVCGKTKQYGHNVSHSKRRTKRVFMPNVFGKRMLVASQKYAPYLGKVSGSGAKVNNGQNGEIRRVKICSKCLKRVKKFGLVYAKENTVLQGNLLKMVDWKKMAKVKSLKSAESKPEKKVDAPKEISVEELVGKKQ